MFKNLIFSCLVTCAFTANHWYSCISSGFGIGVTDPYIILHEVELKIIPIRCNAHESISLFFSRNVWMSAVEGFVFHEGKYSKNTQTIKKKIIGFVDSSKVEFFLDFKNIVIGCYFSYRHFNSGANTGKVDLYNVYKSISSTNIELNVNKQDSSEYIAGLFFEAFKINNLLCDYKFHLSCGIILLGNSMISAFTLEDENNYDEQLNFCAKHYGFESRLSLTIPCFRNKENTAIGIKVQTSLCYIVNGILEEEERITGESSDFYVELVGPVFPIKNNIIIGVSLFLSYVL